MSVSPAPSTRQGIRPRVRRDGGGIHAPARFHRKQLSEWTGRADLDPDASYGEFDAFFEAGNFTALLGCNTWAAAALRKAGLQTGWWNPLPQTLGLSLDLHN